MVPSYWVTSIPIWLVMVIILFLSPLPLSFGLFHLQPSSDSGAVFLHSAWDECHTVLFDCCHFLSSAKKCERGSWRRKKREKISWSLRVAHSLRTFKLLQWTESLYTSSMESRPEHGALLSHRLHLQSMWKEKFAFLCPTALLSQYITSKPVF